MVKFKVGDRVILTLDVTDWLKKGMKGTIIEKKSDRFDYAVYIEDEKGEFLFYEEELRHGRVKDTKIARAFYKNNISRIEDGWLWLGSK